MPRKLFNPHYGESYALIIGINKYQYVRPLLHACNDATSVAELLTDQFSFKKSNIQILTEASASRSDILRAFLSYASDTIEDDDRILIFFAGHGHTIRGRRGDIGYLVPVDGRTDDLSTLIRWDELTRNADIISAKHILFLMDACYGGLALTRSAIPPGSMRLVKDMLQRYSRQVLTAGKGDEVVSDGGGTRLNNSIFTSHLLDGLEGAAAPAGGIVTGHSLMAYVYDKVGTDPHSKQTPHFGHVEGDGDFIFDTSVLATLKPTTPSSEPEPDLDVLIRTSSMSPPEKAEIESVAEVLKRLISSPTGKIALSDYIRELVRKAVRDLDQSNFPPHGNITNEEVVDRLLRYEDAVSDLLIAVTVLSHWAEGDQIKLLKTIFSRIGEIEKPQGGTFGWIRLPWYPVMLLMYAAGISSLAADRYDTLAIALETNLPEGRRGKSTALVLPVVDELTEVHEVFKMLPDMNTKYVPRSEYIHKKLQPILEDQLYLGRSYDRLFDEFEILLALSYANNKYDDASHTWGPPGRFAWKERGRAEDPVYTNYVNRAKSLGQNWEALKAGLFKGQSERFAAIADAYAQRLSRVNWW